MKIWSVTDIDLEDLSQKVQELKGTELAETDERVSQLVMKLEDVLKYGRVEPVTSKVEGLFRTLRMCGYGLVGWGGTREELESEKHIECSARVMQHLFKNGRYGAEISKDEARFLAECLPQLSYVLPDNIIENCSSGHSVSELLSGIFAKGSHTTMGYLDHASIEFIRRGYFENLGTYNSKGIMETPVEHRVRLVLQGWVTWAYLPCIGMPFYKRLLNPWIYRDKMLNLKAQSESLVRFFEEPEYLEAFEFHIGEMGNDEPQRKYLLKLIQEYKQRDSKLQAGS